MIWKLSDNHKYWIKRAVQAGVIFTLLLRNISVGLSDRSYLPESGKTAILQPLLTNAHNQEGYFNAFEHRMERFLKRWEIPGASIAIARHGKLIYAGGLGYMDMDQEIPAEPYHLFRIASISKLITATAIFRLVEEDKLELTDRVFGPDGILDTSLYDMPADRKALEITVGHLLEHSGGWTTRWGDHMFMPDVVAEQMGVEMPPSVSDIIAFALSKRLHFTPGTWSSYSNLGYAILGEVISRVSGMDYEEYVKTELLLPLGITDCYIGGNTSEEAYQREVKYYETENAEMIPAIDGSGKLAPRSDGGNDVRSLGAAGGWVTTSYDLLKFVLSVDGESTRPDILGPGSVWRMTDGSGLWGPLGWRGIHPAGNWWRTGSFAGTSAILEKQPDGITWVVLMNASAWRGADFPAIIRQEMHRSLNSIKDWPGYDLFLRYEMPTLAGK